MKGLIMGTLAGAVALLAVMATASPVAAQNQGKVAYVNTREILSATPGYAAAESLYAKEFEAAQEQAQKLRQSFDSAANDFQRQSTMLNATQRAAKSKALEDYAKTTQEKVQALELKMRNRERELLDPIQRRINSVIEGQRAAGGYAIVFDVSSPNSGIVTADTSLDLTDKVIQQLK